MAVIKCANNHYYDDSKYTECPHCKAGLPNQANAPGGLDRHIEDMMTVAKFTPKISVMPQQGVSGRSSGFDDEKTMNMQQKSIFAGSASRGEEKTVGMFKQKMKMDPVVGWIVCVSGPERGRDYRVRAGRNFVGRSHKMDISIVDDEQISRENHCSIIYDPKGNAFSLVSGDGTAAYVDNEFIEGTAPLVNNSVIKIGESEFIFVPYCMEGRTWL